MKAYRKIPQAKRIKSVKRSVSKLNSKGGWKHNGTFQYGNTCQPIGKKHIKFKKVRKISSNDKNRNH